MVEFVIVNNRMPPYHDFAAHENRQKEFSHFTQRFVLNRDFLTNFQLPILLAWTTVRFDESTRDLIADEPGLYAFVVQSGAPGLPPHGYVTYIGQTWKGGNRRRTLRKRFAEYLLEQRRPKRKHIWEMLNKWKPCISFAYATVDPTTASLKVIEAQLNDAMIPPYSHQDFSADVRKRKRLWEKL